MKFICLQEHLAKSIGTVERAVAKTAHLPALTHILIEASEGRLRLAATDLEIGIVSWCQGKSEEDGRVTVPAKTVAGLIATLQPEKLTLRSSGADCVLSGGALSATLKGLPSDDFPLIPEIKNELPLTTDSARLKQGLGRVIESAAPESTRPELGGILFGLGKDLLTLVATDSFRLSIVTIPSLQTGGVSPLFFQDHGVIIPGKTVRELTHLIDIEDPQLFISVSENQIQFTQKNYRLVSRLIEGTYPRYEDIIPTTFLGERLFNRRDLLSALKRIEFFSGKMQRVELSLKADECVISTEDPFLGSASEKVKSEGQGPEKKFAFNIRYLLSGLATFTEDNITLEYNESATPAIFRSEEAG
ncbi:MAG: DNA polymerase III subunit beta, partial [Patescibacteria group bacterium]|nr:DNA polymerase III subunit beta [Patescibacteria group bacterium]